MDKAQNLPNPVEAGYQMPCKISGLRLRRQEPIAIYIGGLGYASPGKFEIFLFSLLEYYSLMPQTKGIPMEVSDEIV